MITSLKDNEILIVGTNERGNHWGGAAAQAHKDFGLAWGVGEGLCQKTYAFPTLDKNMQQRTGKALKLSVKKLFKLANMLPTSTFILTPVGTGIAGFSHEYMSSLFKGAPKNIIKPSNW